MKLNKLPSPNPPLLRCILASLLHYYYYYTNTFCFKLFSKGSAKRFFLSNMSMLSTKKYLFAYRTLWLGTCRFKALKNHHRGSWASTRLAEDRTTTQSIWVENKILSYQNASIYKRYWYIKYLFLFSSAVYSWELTRQIAQVRSCSRLIESGRTNVITALVMFSSHEKRP